MSHSKTGRLAAAVSVALLSPVAAAACSGAIADSDRLTDGGSPDVTAPSADGAADATVEATAVDQSIPDGPAESETSAVDSPSDGGGRSEGGAESDAAGDAPSPDAPGPDAALQDASGLDSGNDAPPEAGVCQGICALLPPAGWFGPWEVGAAASLPQCDPGYPYAAGIGGQGLVVPPTTCSCSCQAPSGSCADPTFVVSESVSSCAEGLACASGSVPQIFCGAMPASSPCDLDAGAGDAGPVVFSVEAPALDGGCVPNQTYPPFSSPLSYAINAVGCSPGIVEYCDATHQCLPPTSPPFGPTACIGWNGDTACPAGPYSVRSTYYQAWSDGRNCSTCTCGPPAEPFCTGTLFLSNYSDCTMNGVSLEIGLDGTPCLPLPVGSWVASLEPASPNSCQAGTSTFSGSASPIDPFTVCCTQ